MPRAFITGVAGQDGSYLSELLLDEGLEVFGLARYGADASRWRIAHLLDRPGFRVCRGDVTDASCMHRLLTEIRPQYVFNLAANSFVPYSWEAAEATAQSTGIGALNVLEAIRAIDPSIRFYQASSSEMFGNAPIAPQTEETYLRPRSPYGVAKVFAHNITVNYRESFGLFAASGILFNHESERRGLSFVTRKVTWAVARIKAGLQDTLAVGNLDAVRDWGYAPEYVQMMWLMLQADTPDDYVIASGVNHSVRELCQAAFGAAGLNWEKYTITDSRYLRPAELHTLLGDSSKAASALGWRPAVDFEQMVERMVSADIRRVEQGISWEV